MSAIEGFYSIPVTYCVLNYNAQNNILSVSSRELRYSLILTEPLHGGIYRIQFLCLYSFSASRR